MCETGGLTQKQSLRGLLLRHLLRIVEFRGLVFCQLRQDALIIEVETTSKYDAFSTSAVFGPEGAKSVFKRINLGFLGAFPKTALG